MSSKTRSLIVAGTVGLVEALKDQGFARWNYTIRTIHHHAKSNIRSVAQSNKLSAPAAMASSKGIEQSEESLRKVMYLSCWVGLVEALKDQGFARWNYTIRTIHHHAKSNIRSVTQSKKLSASAAMASSKGIEQSEESLRKVMYLSCWGPN
nr:hypothetical protein [Tanacetum cinerariifolium]GEW19615.1 hypothetical protein [Tanacetum cinerariifolium]